MKSWTTILGTVALVCTGANAAQAADATCHVKRLAKFDLQVDSWGRPVVPVKLAGKTINMLIDTNGVFSAVTESTVNKLDLAHVVLPRGAMRASGRNVLPYTAEGKGFTLGTIPVPSYAFEVLYDTKMNGLDGLLGADLLTLFDVDLDFPNKTLNLMEPNACADGPVYWPGNVAKLPFDFPDTSEKDDISMVDSPTAGTVSVMERRSVPIKTKAIITQGQLDGVDVKVVINTATAVSTISLVQARSLFHWQSDPPELTPTKSVQPDQARLYAYPFKTLTLGGITINNPRILIRDVGTTPSKTSDMILGASTLQHLHTYISYKDKVLYMTPVAPPPPDSASPAKPN